MDIGMLRSQTPGCSQHVHFNNAGAALMPRPVMQAMQQHMKRELEHGGYEAADMVRDDVEDFYRAAAELIGADDPLHIAYADNASRAWQSIFLAAQLGADDTVLCARGEYSSNYLTLLHSACHVKMVEPTAQAIEAAIDPSVKLILLTQLGSECGKIHPAKEIGAVAKQHEIPFLLDTTQTIGQMPIDVKELACSALVATGRKFLRGPRGTGFLWIDPEWLPKLRPAVVDLYSAKWDGPNSYKLVEGARRFETWERSFVGMLGLRAAMRYALSIGMDAIWERIQELSAYARARLSEVDGLELGDCGEQASAIITVRSKEYPAEALQTMISAYGINVSLAQEGISYRKDCSLSEGDWVRISLHYYNTNKEIDRLIKALNTPLI